MNEKTKCAICGLTTVLLIETTPLCEKCVEEKHYHKPENSYCSSLATSNISTNTMAISGISDTTTVTTQPYYE